MKNDRCVLIPTCNRSDAIDFYLKSRLDVLRNDHFDVIIYDSSTDDRTKNVVENFIAKDYSNLQYVHYNDPTDDLYGVKKVAVALSEYANNYEYVWLCGDTTILLLEEYEKEMLELIKKDYDVIHIYVNNKNIGSQQDMNYKIFFENFFWSMTHWCSFILSKRLIREMDKWNDEYIKLNITAVTVFTIFAALANRGFKIAYINHRGYKCSPYRTHAMSQQNKELLRGYAEMISIGINNLPKEYDTVKSAAKKNFTKNTGMFSWQGAIDLRTDGNLTLRKLNKYKKHLIQMTDVPIAWFYLWSVLPAGIARKLSNTYVIKIYGSQKLQEINKNKGKLILYGAGEHGSEILEKIQLIYKDITVLAISDKNWDRARKGHQIIPPCDICKYPYDHVGIAIVNGKIYKEARRELIRMGIPAKRIFHI
ncbi:MAG: hypothetical protein K2O97_03015 [Acetatifactor sp.]|nr:hypothetical protein [Acetatifactor sp.]